MSLSPVRLDCATCVGQDPSIVSVCAVCNGQGKVLVYEPLTRCPHCNGSGHNNQAKMFIGPFCVVCNGRGWALSEVIPVATHN
jgi:DnaJ-class molecular chaperone